MLTKDNRSELLSIAKESITGFVTNHTIPKFEIKSAPLKTPSGVFVTIHKNGELRGCIGYSEPIKPLWEAVRDTAISAAVNDPHSEPVDKSELPELEIEISVLSPLKKNLSPEKIEVGKLGLLIKKGFYTGLLLPQVPVELGWDREEFLRQTCLKAGLPPDEWEKEAEIYTFEADIFSEKSEEKY